MDAASRTEQVKVLPGFFVDVLRIVDEKDGRLWLIVEDIVGWIGGIGDQFVNHLFDLLSLQRACELIHVDVQFIEEWSQQVQVFGVT